MEAKRRGQAIKITSIILAVIIFGGGVILFTNNGESTPIKASLNFLNSLESGNFDQARKYLNRETDKSMTESQLDRMKDKLFGGTAITVGGPDNLTISGGNRATLTLITLVNSKNGPSSGHSIMTFSKSIFGWKIDNIDIGF